MSRPYWSSVASVQDASSTDQRRKPPTNQQRSNAALLKSAAEPGVYIRIVDIYGVTAERVHIFAGLTDD
jgi:hypothetical protein